MKDTIDFVVTWVDGNDEAWKKQKQSFASGCNDENDGIVRYRDWDLMRYWFRGVEKFAPWVNKVYFVTCGQIPKWLNTNHPKLKTIFHCEYMPASALPTFNSRAIEFCFHRIEELSEKFVLFNDDIFIIDSIAPTTFFRNGIPCDYAALGILTPLKEFYHIVLNNMILINNHFSVHQCLKKYPTKWFSLKDIRSTLKTILLCPFRNFSWLATYHNAIPYTKSEFTAMWERFPEKFNGTVHHRFRCNEDVTHWAIRYWRLASGQFYPFSQRYSYYIALENDNSFARAIDIISRQKKKEICLNDVYQGDQFEKHKTSLQKAFETILPTPSSFEMS